MNICPICHKTLQFKIVSKVSVFECPTKDTTLNVPHFYVEKDSALEIQYIIHYPYMAHSVKNDKKSKIFKKTNSNRWAFHLELDKNHHTNMYSHIKELSGA